jgi:molecular chaperone GrpE
MDERGRRDEDDPGELAGAADGEAGDIEILGFEGEADVVEPAARAATSPPAAAEDGDDRLRTELRAAEDRYVRLRADFDNFRKRSEREREEVLRYVLVEPLRALLPVVDNLERALTAQGSLEDLRRGVEMIARQIGETLRKLGLSEVPAVGERFDPRMHEAVMREESDTVEAPTVIAEFQRGYWLHDRLLRPAMVRVAVPVDAGGQDAAADAAAASGASGEEGS